MTTGHDKNAETGLSAHEEKEFWKTVRRALDRREAESGAVLWRWLSRGAAGDRIQLSWALRTLSGTREPKDNATVADAVAGAERRIRLWTAIRDLYGALGVPPGEERERLAESALASMRALSGEHERPAPDDGKEREK